VQQTLPFKFDGDENELNNKESAASGEKEPEEDETTTKKKKKKKKKKTPAKKPGFKKLQRQLRAHRRRASKNLTDKEVMANSELILVGIHHGRKGEPFLYYANKEGVYVVGSAPEGGETYEMKCIIAKFIADTPGFEFLKTPCKMEPSNGVLVWPRKGVYTWNQRFKEAVLHLLGEHEIEELKQCTLFEYVAAVNNIEEGTHKNVSRPAYFKDLVPEHTSQDKAIVMLTNLRFLVPQAVNLLLQDKQANGAEMTSEIPGVSFKVDKRPGCKSRWCANFTPVPGGKSVLVTNAHLGPNKSVSNKEHLTEFMLDHHAKRFNKEKVVFVELYKNEENNQLAARVHTCVEAKRGEPVPRGKFSVLTLLKALRPHHKELGAAVDKFHGVSAAASGTKKHFAPKRKRFDDGSAQDAQKKAKTA
jgi:hypothetical protein